ncbi:hypothetical protein Q9R46_23420 [Paenibacillus sp. RRE4]|uniref:hypothetical protein n=1 Tax=Paenibacillus sp. RRE4 TaxID=2962587 RepID=UPI002880BE97|nr:hypothetical protein [Paenibacillus sp. RRE4]MDT0125630.1 hypothetical protein [Paenibacillus sp. RRE4]
MARPTSIELSSGERVAWPASIELSSDERVAWPASIELSSGERVVRPVSIELSPVSAWHGLPASSSSPAPRSGITSVEICVGAPWQALVSMGLSYRAPAAQSADIASRPSIRGYNIPFYLARAPHIQYASLENKKEPESITRIGSGSFI